MVMRIGEGHTPLPENPIDTKEELIPDVSGGLDNFGVNQWVNRPPEQPIQAYVRAFPISIANASTSVPTVQTIEAPVTPDFWVICFTVRDNNLAAPGAILSRVRIGQGADSVDEVDLHASALGGLASPPFRVVLRGRDGITRLNMSLVSTAIAVSVISAVSGTAWAVTGIDPSNIGVQV